MQPLGMHKGATDREFVEVRLVLSLGCDVGYWHGLLQFVVEDADNAKTLAVIADSNDRATLDQNSIAGDIAYVAASGSHDNVAVGLDLEEVAHGDTLELCKDWALGVVLEFHVSPPDP